MKSNNNWRLIFTEDKNKIASNNDAELNVLDNALEDLTLQILRGVKTVNYGAFDTADQNVSSGYYVVKWTSKPYTLRENTQLDDYIPPVTVPAGEFVANAQYMNPVAKSNLLYTYPKSKDVLNTCVRMRYIIKPNFRATKTTKKKCLSDSSNKFWKQIQKFNTILIDASDHEDIIEAMFRRSQLEHEETR